MHRRLVLILALAWTSACSAAATNDAEPSNQQAAPNQAVSAWTVRRVTLEEGVMAWELGREHAGGRAAYRIFGGIQRGVGIACNGWQRDTSGPSSPEATERRDAARESILGLIREEQCEIGADVLDGFDAGFAELERRAQAEPLPAAQNWLPQIGGFGVKRHEHDFQIEVNLADSPNELRGEARLFAYGESCPIGESQQEERFATGGGAAARAAAARATLSRMVAEAARRCHYPPATAERWMAGFDEALAAAETRLAAAAAGD